MLRLKAKAVSRLIIPSSFAGDGTIQIVPGIELHTWLSRQALEYASAHRIRGARDHIKAARRMVEDEIVVVAAADF